MSKPSFGMIGLAVMGSNLAQNVERNGWPVAVFNRNAEVTKNFMSLVPGKKFVPSFTLQEFIQSLERPRKVFILVKAGAPVDDVLDQLLPLVNEGDILMDGGNSYFTDTQRREKRCRERKVHFLGVGVSGGEKGALEGASIMPGGARDAWELMSPLFSAISAKVDGEACTGYVGPDGAGHFVKMVHNGIEYGDMQLIAEIYHLLQVGAGLTPRELAPIFHQWNQGKLSSYLIEITAKIFERRDDRSDGYLVDAILDAAGQKGTGKWTSQVALDLGVASPTLAAAVDARILSSLKKERVFAESTWSAKRPMVKGNKEALIADCESALWCAKILAYAQGMAILSAASKEYKWDLKLGEIASMWRGGCIIRAKFLHVIRRAFERNSGLTNLVLDAEVLSELRSSHEPLRRVVAYASQAGISTLALGSALSYLDSYTSGRLPQNLTQAQRDFFGSHTYERVDGPGTHHTEWEEK